MNGVAWTRGWVIVWLITTGVGGSPALAHELRPALLSLAEQSVSHYRVLWKLPLQGQATPPIRPVFPYDCRAATPVRQSRDGQGVSRFWSLDCERPLSGRILSLSGLQDANADALVYIRHQDGRTGSHRMGPEREWLRLPEAQGLGGIAREYGRLGVEHILTGVDHLLFVFALFLLVQGGWALFKAVTAFTLAHSITLAAAALGLVRVPSAPVEVVIALSIVYLATELARRHRRPEREPGLTDRRPWLMALIFGLLHGLGFAGALAEVGLPQQAILPALVFFNLGVEVGQLLFIAAILPLAWLLSHRSTPNWRHGRLVLIYGIGGLSSFWLIQRVAGI